jgi:hypothetical protein
MVLGRERTYWGKGTMNKRVTGCEGRGNKEEPGVRGGAEKRTKCWNKGILNSPAEIC